MKHKKNRFTESSSHAVVKGRKVLATKREIEFGYGPAAVRLRHRSSDENYVGSDLHLKDLKTFKRGKRKDNDAASGTITGCITLCGEVTRKFFAREIVN